MATALEPKRARDVSSVVTVARDALLDGLGKVSLVAARNGNKLPVLAQMRMAPEGDGLRLTATDLDRTVSAWVTADGVRGFPARLVPCHRLLAIVSQLPLGSLHVGALGDSSVRVTSGRARFDLAGLAADEFPDYLADKDDGNATSVAIDGPAFVAALGRCGSCASNAQSRPTLNGVHVKAGRNERLLIEATDGNALMREWVERATGPALDVILPSPSVPVITKLFADAASITLAVSAGRVVIAASDGPTEPTAHTRVVTKLVDGPYPDTSRVIPIESTREATVDRAAFLTAVKRVGALTNEDTFALRLEWSADRLTLHGLGKDDIGDAEDEAPCAFVGDAPFRITLGYRYLLQALSFCSAETIRVGMTRPERAITVRDEGFPEPQHVIMPRRDLGD